jgi:hypothetical protein
MTKFIVLYRATTSARAQMANATPEQAKAGMDAWMAWAAKAGDAIVDLGAPLAPATHLGPGSGAESSDIAGFSVFQAESAEVVAGLLDSNPHLEMPGSSIDVLEYLPMPGT